MKIVDLNVLLYAVNADSAHHRPLLENPLGKPGR